MTAELTISIIIPFTGTALFKPTPLSGHALTDTQLGYSDVHNSPVSMKTFYQASIKSPCEYNAYMLVVFPSQGGSPVNTKKGEGLLKPLHFSWPDHPKNMQQLIFCHHVQRDNKK